MKEFTPSLGAPILSGLILTAFAGVTVLVLTRAIPEGSAPLANVLLGSMSALAGQVANYWLGSSAGSARKDHLLAEAALAAAPAPAADPAP